MKEDPSLTARPGSYAGLVRAVRKADERKAGFGS